MRYVFFLAVMLVLPVTSATSAERLWHHGEDGFRNPKGSVERDAPWYDRLGFSVRRLWASFVGTDDVWDDDHVYTQAQALASLRRAEGQDSLTWLGHSTFLLHLSNMWILTDPFLSQRASPVSWVGPKRSIMPPLTVPALPALDILVVSHNHYDHLSTETIEQLPHKDTMTVIVPLKMGVFFTTRGYKNVIELDWWQQITVRGVTVHMLPAVHWSRRGLFDGNAMLWASFAFVTADNVIYHSGDTDQHPQLFKQIGDYLGRCDIGLLAIGAYEPRNIMKGSHMTPQQAVAMGQDLGCNALIGHHWGTISISDEGFMEPEMLFFQAATDAKQKVIDMAIGQTILLNKKDF